MSKIRDVEKQLLSLVKEYPWFEDVRLNCRAGHVNMGVHLQHEVPIFQCEDPKETALRLIGLFQKSIDVARKEIEVDAMSDKKKNVGNGPTEKLEIEWENVTECVTCPLKYKTGDKSMCNLGIGEIPQQGISRNCPVIRYDTRLLKKVVDTKPGT